MYQPTIFQVTKAQVSAKISISALDAYKASLSPQQLTSLRYSLADFLAGDKTQLGTPALKAFLMQLSQEVHINMSDISKPSVKRALEKILERLDTCAVAMPSL